MLRFTRFIRWKMFLRGKGATSCTSCRRTTKDGLAVVNWTTEVENFTRILLQVLSKLYDGNESETLLV